MKLEAWNLLGIGLLYFGIQNSNSDIITDIRDKICYECELHPKITIVSIFLVTIGILLRTQESAHIEHTIMLICYTIGFKGMLLLLSSNEETDYYVTLMTCLVLSAMYNQVIPRENIYATYFALAGYVYARLCEKQTTSANAIRDVTFAHLVFYYTK